MLPQWPTAMLCLVSLSLLGCGRGVIVTLPQAPEHPVINLADPESIRRWEDSEYNVFSAKIHVTDLTLLRGTLGGGGAKVSRPVAIEVAYAKSHSIDPGQKATIEGLAGQEAVIHKALRQAVYSYYERHYSTYKQAWSMSTSFIGGNPNELDQILPNVVNGDELDDLVEFGSISIHPTLNGSTAIGFEFWVPWDVEHGLGARWENGVVVAIDIDGQAMPLQPPTQK